VRHGENVAHRSCVPGPHTMTLLKYILDKEDLSNYRPISHLSILSKLNERVVKNRHTSHLSTHNLLNSYQSTYTKHHSTESTFLAVHDHMIKSMSEHKVTALCLLDLSAAFDTIDHSILLHRLSSWFGFDGKSSLRQCVPQGSVFGPLLFIFYSTPLSSLISDSFVGHHLFADETLLFISIRAPEFSANILHLRYN